MAKTSKNLLARRRRKVRIRKKVSGTAAMPRLSVFRSNKYVYAQLIDDVAGNTLVTASSLDKGLGGTPDTVAGAAKVGEMLASRAKESGIKTVVFDRNGYQFHGVVKSLADAARKGGLKF